MVNVPTNGIGQAPTLGDGTVSGIILGPRSKIPKI
jgi:hypothetical protein